MNPLGITKTLSQLHKYMSSKWDWNSLLPNGVNGVIPNKSHKVLPPEKKNNFSNPSAKGLRRKVGS